MANKLIMQNHSSSSSYIHVIFGPMFSGKTNELIRIIRRFVLAKKRVLVIKYINDQRYTKETQLLSHDGSNLTTSEFTTIEYINDLSEWLSVNMDRIKSDYDIIAIDEGQFFDDLVHCTDTICSTLEKIVIVSGLLSNSCRLPFVNNQMNILLANAESSIQLNAICVVCGSTAAFTKSFVNSDGSNMIGGSDIYFPVCRYHHLNMKVEDI